jgi:hypothetical protein
LPVILFFDFTLFFLTILPRYQEDFPLAKRQLDSVEKGVDLPAEILRWREGFYKVLSTVPEGISREGHQQGSPAIARIQSVGASKNSVARFMAYCVVGLMVHSLFA